MLVLCCVLNSPRGSCNKGNHFIFTIIFIRIIINSHLILEIKFDLATICSIYFKVNLTLVIKSTIIEKHELTMI